MRKVQSMCNLHPTPSSRDPYFPAPEIEEEQEETPIAEGQKEGYLSDSHVPSGSNRERKKGVPWTEEEHRMFLLGLQKLGKGDWRGISRHYVQSRTPTQVASHAQKYFIRQSNLNKRKRRSSLFDIVTDSGVPIPGSKPAPPTEPTKAAPGTSPPFGSSPPVSSYNPYFVGPFAHHLAAANAANASSTAHASENVGSTSSGSAGSNSTAWNTDKGTAPAEGVRGSEEVRSNPVASTASPTYSGFHMPLSTEAQAQQMAAFTAAFQQGAFAPGGGFPPHAFPWIFGFPGLPLNPPIPQKVPSKSSNVVRPTPKHATPGTWPYSCPIPGIYDKDDDKSPMMKPDAAMSDADGSHDTGKQDRVGGMKSEGGIGNADTCQVGSGPSSTGGYTGYGLQGHSDSFRRVTPMCS